jgi:hypothetical protein
MLVLAADTSFELEDSLRGRNLRGVTVVFSKDGCYAGHSVRKLLCSGDAHSDGIGCLRAVSVGS